jgi:hypothetical protein
MRKNMVGAVEEEGVPTQSSQEAEWICHRKGAEHKAAPRDSPE